MDHHAGKKQNISSGFSVFPSVGHLGKRRWVTSEKRRRHSRAFITTQSLQNEKAPEKQVILVFDLQEPTAGG
jgi:hypothetical protein